MLAKEVDFMSLTVDACLKSDECSSSYFDVLRSTDCVMDAAVSKLFNLTPALTRADIFVHGLQNLFIIIAWLH